MDPKVFTFSIVLFLHNLFTVVWMGGMIVNAISFMPSVRSTLGPGPEMKKVMAAFRKRQSLFVYISMVGLIVTGFLMSRRSPEFVRLFAFSNPFSIALSLKHILVLIMIGIALYRALILGRQQPPAPQGKKQPGPGQPGQPPKPGAGPSGKEKLNALLLSINAVLAVVVLLLSAFVSAMAGA